MKYIIILFFLCLTGCADDSLYSIERSSYEVGCFTAMNKMYSLLKLKSVKEIKNFDAIRFCKINSQDFIGRIHK